MQNYVRVSVVMCTFNGEKYLLEQLESIANQKRLPDEVIVVDDASTDNTYEILQEFRANAAFDVRIYQNTINLGSREAYGYARVFADAAQKATGDILFFSDQDDYWYPDKIKMHLEWHALPNTFVVTNEAMRVDKLLKPYNTIESRFNSPPEWLKEFRIGCCCSLKKSFFDLISPFPTYVGHDMWISISGAVFKASYNTGLVLQDYRIHGDQTSGSPGTWKRNFGRLMSLFNDKSETYANTKTLANRNVLNRLDLLKNRTGEEPGFIKLDNDRITHIESVLNDELDRYLFLSKLYRKKLMARLKFFLKQQRLKGMYKFCLNDCLRAIRDLLSPSLRLGK